MAAVSASDLCHTLLSAVDHDPAPQVRHAAHLAGSNLATQRNGIPTGMKRTTPARPRCCRVALSFGHGRRLRQDVTPMPPHYLSGNDRGKTKCSRARFVRCPDIFDQVAALHHGRGVAYFGLAWQWQCISHFNLAAIQDNRPTKRVPNRGWEQLQWPPRGHVW